MTPISPRRFFKPEEAFQKPTYDPGAFLNGLIAHMGLKNDAALAAALGLQPPQVSKVRNYKLPITPMILLRAHDASGLPIARLRAMLGD